MARRAEYNVANTTAAAQFSGAGSTYVIQTPSGVLYCVYIDVSTDVVFKKSTDGGASWSRQTTIAATTATALSVWYDRWSNIAAGLIHVAWSDSASGDTLYRTINTESSDALSTQTVIFAGTSTAAGGHLSITRAVGGNVFCKTCIDAGTEGGFFRLPAANVPNGAWDAARTIDEANATQDKIILLPDFDAADTNDIMAIFWDNSANEISRKLHDDSANSWSEVSIATGMTGLNAATAYPTFYVAPDIANTRHILVAWSAVDTASARLRAWHIDSGAITALTDVVASSTDDQGLCAVALDLQTGFYHVWYAGKTDGSETWFTALNVYGKTSKDSGTTWGAETLYSLRGAVGTVQLMSVPRIYLGPPGFIWNDEGPNELIYNYDHVQPRARSLIGV